MGITQKTQLVTTEGHFGNGQPNPSVHPHMSITDLTTVTESKTNTHTWSDNSRNTTYRLYINLGDKAELFSFCCFLPWDGSSGWTGRAHSSSERRRRSAGWKTNTYSADRVLTQNRVYRAPKASQFPSFITVSGEIIIPMCYRTT